jgi:hypothetical protein
LPTWKTFISFYGTETGVRIARKHISWYTKGLVGSAAFRHMMNQLPTIALQRQAVNDFFLMLAEHHEHLPYVNSDRPRRCQATPIVRISPHEATSRRG